MDMWVKRQENQVSSKCPNIGDLRVTSIEAQGPQGDVQEGKRLMIIELERYNEIGELIIQNHHRVTGTNMLSGWRPESICNYGSCQHGEEGDGDVNMTQRCIQLAFGSGMRAGTHTTAAEQSKKHYHAIRCQEQVF